MFKPTEVTDHREKNEGVENAGMERRVGGREKEMVSMENASRHGNRKAWPPKPALPMPVNLCRLI